MQERRKHSIPVAYDRRRAYVPPTEPETPPDDTFTNTLMTEIETGMFDSPSTPDTGSSFDPGPSDSFGGGGGFDGGGAGGSF